MSEEQVTQIEPNWRQYYDNPLTVATNAMLHINGSEDGHQSGHPIIYEYKGDIGQIASSSVGGTVELKLSNGSLESSSGAVHVESIFLQGGAEVVKREPEDLTRKCISPNSRVDNRRALLVPLVNSDSPPALIPSKCVKDEFANAIEIQVCKEERCHREERVCSGLPSRTLSTGSSGHTILIQAPLSSAVTHVQLQQDPSSSASKMSASGYLSSFQGTVSPQPNSYDSVPYLASSPQPSYASAPSPAIRSSPATIYSSAEPYYREYYQQAFPAYEDISQPTTIVTGDLRALPVGGSSPTEPRNSPATTPVGGNSRPWHDFPRQEGDKIQIPKIHSEDDKIHIDKLEHPYGLKFHLESPISTSPRREDDRITYINKGQFYPITMEYIPDPDRPLKSNIIKSVVMLLFREEKTGDDERKAWQFWHARQHSVKQRILDVDTKNSVGVSCIEEISHNAIAVYWNPIESPGKINVAVQCLSTDFSSQKGVKGLPLHIQIDNYEDPRDSGFPVYQRSYCQVKVFCDKGAERKTRDEERRAQKRRMNPTSRKKYEDLYHTSCDRSEFYIMADLVKEPALFRPSDDCDNKGSYMNNIEMQQGSFYSHENESGVCGSSLGTSMDGTSSPTLLSPQHASSPAPGGFHTPISNIEHPPQSPLSIVSLSHVASSSSSSTSPNITVSSHNIPSAAHSITTLVPLHNQESIKSSNLHRYHYGQIQNAYGEIHKDLNCNVPLNGSIAQQSIEDIFPHAHKRTRLSPPPNERIMIFVRREGEDIFTPLHLVPPGYLGLLIAIEEKFQIPRTRIKCIFRKNKHGVRARIDDDMIRHYCNEDCFTMEIHGRDQDSYEITLNELMTAGECIQ